MAISTHTAVSLLICLLNCQIWAYEHGAPCAAQFNMHPSSVYHGESRDLRQSPPPYRFFIAEFDDLSPGRIYIPGQNYTIRLIALDGAHFRGFIIQPRLATREGSLIGNLRAGHFILDQAQMEEHGIRFQDCPPHKNDSITHRSGTSKYFLEAKWMVDKNYGPIQFVITVLQEQDEFWEMWRPQTGLLFPEENASTPTPSPDSEDDTELTARPRVTESDQHKKIRLLSQKLEYHKAIKSNGQIGFIAHDQSENDGDDSVTKRKQVEATSRKPVSAEAAESEDTGLGSRGRSNYTESAQPSSPKSTITLVRLPTPTPPIATTTNETDDGSGDEDDEDEEEATAPPRVGSSINQKLLNATRPKTAQIRPQNAGTANEGSKEGGTESSDPESTDAAKSSFRIPLSRLNRLRDLFQQARQRNRSLTPERASVFLPVSSSFNVEAKSGQPDAKADAEGSAPDPASPARPTLPAANRLEFPTLPPFPVGRTGAPIESVELSGEPSTPTPQSGETDDEDGGTRVTAIYVPTKGTKPAQSVVKLLKTAGDAETETDEGSDKGERAATKLSKAPLTETTPVDGSEPDNISTSPGPIKKGHPESMSTSSLQAGQDGSDLHSVTATPGGESAVEAGASTTATIADPFPKKYLKFNITVPPRRIVHWNGTNETVEDENDSSILKEQDFCSPFPCFNKGTCISIPDEARFECKCSEGWIGNLCDEPDFCGKNPCQNGGQCVNSAFGYTCNCTSVWVGKNCETVCPPNQCKNGGTCSLEEGGGFVCRCKPGFTGSHCETDIDDCAEKPCRNGGTCVDKVDGFICHCPEGYMGQKCHRPCQDIYRSCQSWGEEGRCESTRKTTHWFENNCGVTCGNCVFVNETVKTLTPLPPVLEPLSFLIGRWTVNLTHLRRYPSDYASGDYGYYEEIEFSPVNVPMFGTPSINYTAISRNNQYPEDQMISHGFMTLKLSPNATAQTKVALMSLGNDGITMIEEGVIENDNTLQMQVKYIVAIPEVAHKTLTLGKRQFTLYSGFLRETVERQIANGTIEYFTKYYYKGAEFPIY